MDIYFQGSEMDRIARLFEKLIFTKDNYTTASALVADLTRFHQQLKTLQIDPDKIIRYSILIRALPENFKSIKVVIEQSKDTSLDDNFASVEAAERSQISSAFAAHIKQPMIQRQSNVPVTNQQTNTHKAATNTNSSEKKLRPCKWCGLFDHPHWTCRQKNKNKQRSETKDQTRNNQAKNNGGTGQSSSNTNGTNSNKNCFFGSLSDEEIDFDDKNVENLFCALKLCSSGNDFIDQLLKITTSQVPPTIITPETNNLKEDELWYSDSGCEENATPNKSNFSKLLPANIPGHGKRRFACGRCIVHTGHCPVDRCFYSPDLVGNFLSISSICDRDYGVYFVKTKCYILKDGKVMIKSIRKGKMYAIRAISNSFLVALLSNTPLNNSSPDNQLMSWHRSLGHVNFTDLFRMKKDLGLKGSPRDLECEVCKVAKCNRNPFGNSEIKTTRPRQLIHSDVCGPIRIAN